MPQLQPANYGNTQFDTVTYNDYFPYTPSDNAADNHKQVAWGVILGGAGDLFLTKADDIPGNRVLIKGLAVGVPIKLPHLRIDATGGTTATNITVLFV